MARSVISAERWDAEGQAVRQHRKSVFPHRRVRIVRSCAFPWRDEIETLWARRQIFKVLKPGPNKKVLPSTQTWSFPGKDGEALSKTWELGAHRSDYGLPLAADDPTLEWFAAYTAARHEKRITSHLAERNIEHVLPLYRSIRQWKKSVPVELELPLFPCYVFVRIAASARASVLALPGVHSIVGSPKEPWPLPQADIEALRLGAGMGKLEPHPYLKIGEKVRIKSGPLAGVEGSLVRKKNQFRFVLTLEAIMRSVAVEVDAHDLELVDQAGKPPLRLEENSLLLTATEA